MPGKYTWGETFSLIRLEAKAVRQVAATGDSDAGGNARQDRIHNKAEERWQREAGHAFGQLETAEDEVARAKVELRGARGSEKTAARRAHNEAQAKLRRAQAAARKYR